MIKNKDAFKNCIDQMSGILKELDYDKIASIESRGFVFASPLSYNLQKPNILHVFRSLGVKTESLCWV